MGRKGRKWKETVPMQVVIDAINTKPIKELLPAAKVVCGSDYAVRFYNNKNHPGFYKNEEAFRKALRRCVAIGAFDHRATIVRMLDLEPSMEGGEWGE